MLPHLTYKHLLDQADLEDHLDLPDHLDHKVLLDYVVNQEIPDLQDQTDPVVHLDQLDYQDQMATQAEMENRDHVVWKAHQGPLDLLVSQVFQVPKDTGDSAACKDHLENKVCPEKREALDHQDHMVPQVYKVLAV